MASDTSRPPRIPLVDLKAQYRAIKGEIDEAVRSVIENAAFIMGRHVTGLEESFAALCGAGYGIGVSSATTGLHLVLHAMGIGPGDEVILPSLTFIATAEAVCHAGAAPVFADVDPAALTMDPDSVRRSITDRTRAIIPVHLYGRCANMDHLVPMARGHGLRIVEDAAQAHGAFCSAGRAGSLGDAAVFSFYPGKNLGAFGDGGMITTSDCDLYQRMHMLANHGRTDKYVHEMIGYNYRLDALQAAVVAVKLKHLTRWNGRRLELARRYNAHFGSLRCIAPEAPDGHVFHLYILQVAERDRLIEALHERSIDSGIHYPVPCHRQPCFRGRRTGPLPVTESVVPRLISLPLYPEMTGSDQDRVIDVVDTHCRRYPLEL
ncbi:DegT/DnrJ/EryC1/StrS family aminotransferase [bacterium]|nr:DegT/DnrJ/EryC1/StrS family aminotransferase [candidate division CSSED10-310 bacterium]